jgi:hypothetical protein
MFGNYNYSNCLIPLYGNNVTSPIMCHFSILQPWSPQQHGIIKIYHTIMKYSKCSFVRNAMNIYLQISDQLHWFYDCLICHLQIIWCRFKLWKPQPQFQLLCDNINSKTSIQQHILYYILPNLYLDNYHMIIYCYNSCSYFWYLRTNLFFYGCFIYILNFL